MRYILILILASWVSACSIFGAPTEVDETKGWSAEKIYQAAEEKMRDNDFDKALKYYKTLESRYPHGKYAAQAQLDSIYVYYKKSDPKSTTAAADRFIKLHPNSPSLDYAYYMRGLASFVQPGIIERLTKQSINDRDTAQILNSFNAFKELVSRFPESRYVNDSRLRMVYLMNALAYNEIHVARYYMIRGAYLAAANRCKYVLENYPESNSLEEALVILISAYDRMGFYDLRDDTLRVLNLNYPNSRLLAKGIKTTPSEWWKFWDSLQ
jgi:outer membrane protein assembly factor BamD